MAPHTRNIPWAPLVLELINRGASAGAFHETLENYVTVEIFSKLSAEQKRVLSALSVYRDPMVLDALAQQGLNTDELDALVESGLARQADAETYDVHDLIREFLLRSLSPALREEFHAKCADWYSKQPSSHDVTIELIYHSIRSGQHETASELVVRGGRELVSQGHMELLGLIEQIDSGDLNPLVVVKMSQLRGKFSLFWVVWMTQKRCFLLPSNSLKNMQNCSSKQKFSLPWRT